MRRLIETGGVLTLAALSILAIAIEGMTLWISLAAGWGAFLLTLGLPVVAQFYWIWAQWAATGVFFGWLAILCSAWAAGFAVMLACMALGD